ncbi:matrixin family metalloprotease [Micromonospora profundi]|uniref:matrixin family metalloprotease n=1 Tax=Micromonospora profundi TaxID=1420889 RepID=UPI0033A3C94D
MRRIAAFSAALVGILATIALPASPASAYNLFNCKFNADGNALKWQPAITDSSYSTPAVDAINSWNSASTQFNFTKVTSGANVRVADGNFGQVWHELSFYGIALDIYQNNPVQYSCSGGTWDTTIVAWWNRYYTDSFSAQKRQAIMVHEVGHALGLAHSNGANCADGRIMATDVVAQYNSCGIARPMSDDIAGANAIY